MGTQLRSQNKVQQGQSLGKVRKRSSKREDGQLIRLFCKIAKGVGFVLLALLFPSFLHDWWNGEFEPEMMAFRKEQQKRRSRFLLRKLHEMQMKELNTKAKKRKNDFYK